MKVFIIGGTGLLGSNLVPRLVESNHDVTVLTRYSDKKEFLEKIGASCKIGDILHPEAFQKNINQPELIIFIAMPPIQPGRVNRKKFLHLKEITTKYFQNSMNLAKQYSCPIILTLGTNYHSDTDQVFSEINPIQRFGMPKIGEDIDRPVNESLEKGNPSCIVMMPGQIYGPGGLFMTMYKWIKSGKYRIIGQGNNFVPHIYVEDLAEAYIAAIEKMPLGEKFIIADDTPCTVNDFAQEIASGLKLPPIKHVPKFIVRLVVGKLLFQTITMNCRVSNEKAKRVLGWSPNYSYKDGIKETIKKIESKQAVVLKNNITKE